MALLCAAAASEAVEQPHKSVRQDRTESPWRTKLHCPSAQLAVDWPMHSRVGKAAGCRPGASAAHLRRGVAAFR